MQIFHLKQCNEVKDGRVNITFHAARDASEVFYSDDKSNTVGSIYYTVLEEAQRCKRTHIRTRALRLL